MPETFVSDLQVLWVTATPGLDLRAQETYTVLRLVTTKGNEAKSGETDRFNSQLQATCEWC